jgi:hypothetical protein
MIYEEQKLWLHEKNTLNVTLFISDRGEDAEQFQLTFHVFGLDKRGESQATPTEHWKDNCA